MWSGATNAIPSGCSLCDGNNGTPDLRNKFIVGANTSTGITTYPGLSVGATGGQKDAIVPNHSHPTSIDRNSNLYCTNNIFLWWCWYLLVYHF